MLFWVPLIGKTDKAKSALTVVTVVTGIQLLHLTNLFLLEVTLQVPEMVRQQNQQRKIMTTQQMKSLKTGTVLYDDKQSSRHQQAIICQVLKVERDGAIVQGYDENSKPYYYDSISNRIQELLPWTEAYSLDVVDECRLGEGGYLPYSQNQVK